MQDFGELSDYDFEQVVADLLGAEWRTRVESFPRGRDGGVDLRVLGPTSEPLNLPPKEELVVQCKHMPGATMAQLRGQLRVEASKKIVSKSYRYVLVTSARLTRMNKQEIVRIFGGRLSEADVFARNDIDALLRRHSEVVQANMKLWLASGAALQAFLNQVEYLRSNALRSELERLRSRFVQTSVVTSAQQMLRRFGVCILTGAPGVGKTTTAKILLLRYLSEGWQPAVAISDIRELEAQILPDVKQILFFDDFLGITALPSKLTKGDDAALVRLIHTIENDPSKVFILTTREYVLRQAQQTYERLNDEAFNLTKLMVGIESLTRSERAHILYNQLFFSPLRSAAAAASDGPRRYMALTRHKNYNPRLIEAAIAAAVRDLGLRPDRLTGSADTANSVRSAKNDGDALAASPTGDQYPDVPALLQRALDLPAQLWEHVLLHQLSQLQREILVTRLSLGPEPVSIADFLQVASDFAGASTTRPTQLDLDMALKVLDGDLLIITSQVASAKQLLISGLYPGVSDALIVILLNYPDYLRALMASASTFEQVRWLAELPSIISPQLSREGQLFDDYSTELADCAERNLAAPPVGMNRGLWYHKQSEFADFGMRLEVLSAIYGTAGKRSTAQFADSIVPQFIRAIPRISNRELVRILEALRSDTFRAWRWRRVEINVAVLGQLDNPGDVEEWSQLRDALDLVETTPEYREDLQGRFEEFLEASIEEASEAIDEANDGQDIDLPLAELVELEDLANRWAVLSDIDELIEELEEIKERRDIADADQRRMERTLYQPTLMEANETETQRGTAIFDEL